ncbi:pyruvate formate lyase-activating protein [Ignicoccus pacificus DSM 13166]|uniref:Pyruvate formate lyase-activating protein n=1 Tax=Ignicoccus pacificus DSM 13166 TaxID=940294 RepID=A0A977K8Z7_9CREN|nr:pyruvate formate lyase-activating protein [Ignicoccus pacificus DSM 13166]
MFGEWFFIRPDAVEVWKDPEVNKRLSWYRDVMLNKKQAKFMIAKSLDSGYDDLRDLSEEELWRLHSSLSKEFQERWEETKAGKWFQPVKGNYLDVKAELARRLLGPPCRLCERRCPINRKERPGACFVDSNAYVHSAFLHMGEEAPLVPSGTIFYGGCPFKCVFCQNWDISQSNAMKGKRVDPIELAEIQRTLRERGARNVNHVGGDPIPSAHIIIDSMRYLNVNVPQLWNSNMYMTEELLELLLDIIDIWLPDFKYWNDKCALRLSGVKNYRKIVTRNLLKASQRGDMIIRHLVLPNHLECDTFPILEWIANNIKDKVLVNIMEQYRPEYLVKRYPERWPDVARRVSWGEVMEARRYATELGIVWEPVS